MTTLEKMVLLSVACLVLLSSFLVHKLNKKVSAIEEWRCVSSVVNEYGLETCVQFVKAKGVTLTGKELKSLAEKH